MTRFVLRTTDPSVRELETADFLRAYRTGNESWIAVDPALVVLVRNNRRRAAELRYRTSDGHELRFGRALTPRVRIELQEEFQTYRCVCTVPTPEGTSIEVNPERDFVVDESRGDVYPLAWPKKLSGLRAFMSAAHRPEAMIARREELVRRGIEGARELPRPLETGPAWLVSLEPVPGRHELTIRGKLEMMYARVPADLRAYRPGSSGPAREPKLATFPPLPPPARRNAGVRLVATKDGIFVGRDPERERKLYRQGMPLRCEARTGNFELGPRRLERFITEEYPELGEARIAMRVHPDLVRLLPGRKNESGLAPRAVLTLHEQGGGDWFAGRVAIHGLSPEEWAAVLRAVRSGKRHHRLGDGSWIALDELGMERLLRGLEAAGLRCKSDGSVEGIGPGAVAALESEGVAIEADGEQEDDVQERARGRLQILRERFAVLRSANVRGRRVIRPGKNFRARLRPYQKTGLLFFQRLYEFGAGGILADDMGLGKTVQALAFLSTLHDDPGDPSSSGDADSRPSLIVGPLAALSVWRGEAERFCPGMPVNLWHGPGRENEQLPRAGLVLTTFAVLARDIQRLADLPFRVVMVDEAQHVKNAGSRAAKALRRLSARSIYCLSGTPLENHPGEFWSLMDLCFPGLLGARSAFQKLVGRPDGFARIRERIAPFFLRRTKDSVLPELPPRTESAVAVPLTKVQRALYERERRRARRAMETGSVPHAKNAGQSKASDAAFRVLPHLTRLRRLACHPGLDEGASDREPSLSGKLVYLDERIAELRETASGVLVFSQFTDVLEIVGRLLRQRETPFFLLKGDTPARTRAKQVRDFQAGKVPFFLISLRAGGTALTLTRADVVFHLDPWWNPAAEDQATDRAYRMGQTRPVFVYRLYGENTVEEKVIALQEKKRALFREMFADEGAARVRLDLNAMRELLE